MELMTIEKLQELTPQELREHNANVLLNAREMDGKIVNAEYYSDIHTWRKVEYPSWNFHESYYRLIPGRELRFKNDEECREFMIEHSDKIILRSKTAFTYFNYAQCLNFNDIAQNLYYVFKEHYNCNAPSEIIWREFKTTV